MTLMVTSAVHMDKHIKPRSCPCAMASVKILASETKRQTIDATTVRLVSL